MREESLFYRPKNRLTSAVNTYLGGPTASRKGDPAMRFDRNGVEYHESYGPGPIFRFGWSEVRSVANLPGPVQGRQALCVYLFHEPPVPDIPVEEYGTGTGAALGIGFRKLFGTPIVVHWHHVRGPSLTKLVPLLPAWTAGRIVLAGARPT